MTHRRKSATITLALIAAVTLVACGETERSQRAIYKSRAECIRDWVDENPGPEANAKAEDVCEEIPRGHAYAGGFYGPHFLLLAGRMAFFNPAMNAYAPVPNTAGIARNGFSSNRATGTATFNGAPARAAVSRPAATTFGRPSTSSAITRGGFGAFGRSGASFGS